MADPSLNTNSTFNSNPCNPSNPLKDENGEESILRARASYKALPDNIEDADSKYKELILTLPKERWQLSPMRNYKGFWSLEKFLPGIMAMEEAFQPRPSDVIVASFPKSGTTWLKALTFTIMHRNKYSFSSHPLLKLNPHDCVPFIEFQYAARDEQYLETLPSPRVLGTHVPFSILQEICINLNTSKFPNIVYICREPKDVLVSLWHMIIRYQMGLNESFPFTQVFKLFCEGRMPYGPIWDHVLEYYNYNLKKENILFLKYEQMMKDPFNGVMNLANFIGCPFSEEEIKNGLVDEIVDFCSFNKLKDIDVNKNMGIGNIRNDYFFRKAIVGDWKDNMMPEMAIKLDKITTEKLLNSGFSY